MAKIVLEVSEHEFTIVLGALREATAAIEAWELPSRVGGTKEEIRQVSLNVRAQGERQGAAE